MSTSRLAAWRERLLPEESPEYVALVYALVLVWGLGDILSTYFVFAIVETSAFESNPWMMVMLEYNPLLVTVVKGAVVLYVGVILLELDWLVQRAPGWRVWLSGLVVAGILVVVNNLSVGIRVLARSL